MNPQKLVDQYRVLQAEAERAKPSSQRKTVLDDRVKKLMTDIIAMQNRADKRRDAA